MKINPSPRVCVDEYPVFYLNPATARIKTELGTMERTVFSNDERSISLGLHLAMTDTRILPYFATDMITPASKTENRNLIPTDKVPVKTSGMKQKHLQSIQRMINIHNPGPIRVNRKVVHSKLLSLENRRLLVVQAGLT